MKARWRRRVVLIGLFFLLTYNVEGKKCRLNVVSFNMLFEHVKPSQPERQWVNRLPNAVAFFDRNKPDVVGTQELQTFQIREFISQSGYGWVGVLYYLPKCLCKIGQNSLPL